MLAKNWNVASDGQSVSITLRSDVKFHDGSTNTSELVATELRRVLEPFMGPAFDDVEYIRPTGQSQIDIGFKRPSPFLLEALEAGINTNSGAGTGPFVAVGPSAPNEMRANEHYYLGRPMIDRIVVSPYPNVRSAWADMLRDRIDMLYEVGTDALESLTAARSVSLFTYIRHYQYVLVFNTRTEALRSREVRQALARAIDHDALMRDAFDGHAVASSGPVWPQNWAFRQNLPKASFDPKSAAGMLTSHPVRFKCLVRPGLDRIAIVLKRQLEAVGAVMSIEEAPFDTIVERINDRDFDAVLTELISGPSLLRPYQLWRSGGTGRLKNLGTPKLDAAFDQVRFARNDDEYRAGVASIQQAIVDDPPALFLAWPERARAVSRRFDVAAEPNRDILTTLRLWRPTNALEYANRN